MKLHKRRKINVSIGKTINLGNFESLRLDMSYESTISDDSNLKEEFNETFEFLDELLEETILEKGKK